MGDISETVRKYTELANCARIGAYSFKEVADREKRSLSEREKQAHDELINAAVRYETHIRVLTGLSYSRVNNWY